MVRTLLQAVAFQCRLREEGMKIRVRLRWVRMVGPAEAGCGGRRRPKQKTKAGTPSWRIRWSRGAMELLMLLGKVGMGERQKGQKSAMSVAVSEEWAILLGTPVQKAAHS